MEQEVPRTSSEFILLRESQEYLRKHQSRVALRSRTTFSGNSSSTGRVNLNRFPNNPYFLDEDFQGIRDESGLIQYQDFELDGLSRSQVTGSSYIDSNTGSERKKNRVIVFHPDAVHASADLEVWWVTSPNWRRFIPVFCFFASLCALAHFGAALTWLIMGNDYSSVEDPYECRTENCERISDWMRESMDTNVDPCDDFYGFMCGKFEQEGSFGPDQLEMWKMNSATLEDDILARILKKPEDNRVLRFYKSCIDLRSRRNEGIQAFLDLIDEIGISSRERSLNYIAAKLSNYTGDFMFFGYAYEHRKSIAVNSEDVMSKTFVADIASVKASEDLLNLFRVLTPALAKIKEASAYTGQGDAQDAVSSIQSIVKAVDDIYKKCRDGSMRLAVTAEERGIFDFVEALKIAEGLTFAAGTSYFYDNRDRDECYLDMSTGQLHTIPSILRTSGFSTEKIRFTYRVLWVFRLFLSFQLDVDDVTFRSITNPANTPDFNSALFSEAMEFRKSRIETQCFYSLAINYQLIAFERSAQDFNTEVTMDTKVREYGRRSQRVLRKWSTLGKFSHLSLQDQSHLEEQTKPEQSLRVLIEEKLYRLEDLEESFKDWKPDIKKYFENVWNARRFTEDEMTKDWFFSDTFTPWHTKSGSELLLTVQTTKSHSWTVEETKETMFIPLPLITLPFVTNVFRVLDLAGVSTFVAREIVLLNFRTRLDENNANSTNNTQVSCDCLEGDTPCAYSYSLNALNQPCYTPRRINTFSSALALKVAFELYKEQKEYRTLILKDRHRYNDLVEPTYIPTAKGNEIEYHVYQEEAGLFAKGDRVQLSNLKYKIPLNMALRPKYLKGMKKYNQDQIFFMQFIRLHCFNENDEYKEHVNTILQHVKEFSSAWNCPVDAKLNPEKRWLQ